MASGAEDKAEHAGGKASSSGGGGKLVLILTGVNVVATLGMIGILSLSFLKEKNKQTIDQVTVTESHGEKAEAGGHGGKDAKDPKAAKKASEFGKMVTLEQFTINLATPGSVNPKFVRVNVSLEVPTDDAEAELTSKMPQVRNVIIDLFNSKRPADLASADGRDYIKEEIKNALNGFLVNGKVKGVFFTNFAFSS